jgi:hypothetical protein
VTASRFKVLILGGYGTFGGSFLGLPMPAAWAPRGKAYEFVEHGRFNFDVEIAHSLLGLIVRYRGWLKPRA